MVKNKSENKDLNLEKFLKNRKIKSKAIGIILFCLVILFFITTIIRITGNLS